MLTSFTLYVVVIWASIQPGFGESTAKDIVIYILVALTTVSTQVAYSYFAPNSGSADKSCPINALKKCGGTQ